VYVEYYGGCAPAKHSRYNNKAALLSMQNFSAAMVLGLFQNFIANSKIPNSWGQCSFAAPPLPQTTSGRGHRNTAYRSGDCLLQSTATCNYYTAGRIPKSFKNCVSVFAAGGLWQKNAQPACRRQAVRSVFIPN
jgi:hypothetical protein